MTLQQTRRALNLPHGHSVVYEQCIPFMRTASLEPRFQSSYNHCIPSIAFATPPLYFLAQRCLCLLWATRKIVVRR